MVKKAITHLKLDQANASKLRKLDELAVEHQRVVQAYVDWLIRYEQRLPDRYAAIPITDVATCLSGRWQRCAWRQACGIVQSWYTNDRENPPVLRNLCLQANANVVVLEPSKTPAFDFWLRISTLEAGKPVRIPITLYRRAKATIAEFPKLCMGVTLNRRDEQWYATLVVERRGPKPPAAHVVGVDIGMVNIVSTSTGHCYGQISPELRQRVEQSAAKRRRKQKLNACLKKKGQPAIDLSDHRAEAFARNAIGRALNQLRQDLPDGTAVALERLSVKDMRFKSRQMNRALRASQLGYVRDKLKFKLDEHGIRYRSVQPAYSSQQCSHCGFTFPMNRRSQDRFVCLWCGYEANADENAASNLAKRFGDEELNSLPFRDVETLLALRFMRRLPDARSASAGLDTRVNEVADPSPRSISPVKTPVS
ncbi:MAG: transposase [Chloroflexi bacterium]|nr:transposase [Chloroflexota bacterium]